LSIVASRAPVPVDSGRFEDWPHASGTLALHPLLTVRELGPAERDNTPAWVVYEQRLPSATYARDHPLLARYLPEHWKIERAVVDEITRETPSGRRSAALEDALSSVVALGQPPGLVADPWPGFTAGR
jgi:hypothetical protein